MDYLGDTKRGLLGFSTKSKFQHILETFPLCSVYRADPGFLITHICLIEFNKNSLVSATFTLTLTHVRLTKNKDKTWISYKY